MKLGRKLSGTQIGLLRRVFNRPDLAIFVRRGSCATAKSLARVGIGVVQAQYSVNRERQGYRFLVTAARWYLERVIETGHHAPDIDRDR